jgi:hypothetical protein
LPNCQKYKQKKQPDDFQQAALYDHYSNFLQQITARLLDFIPQATTNYRYFYGSSASYSYIKPYLLYFVKEKEKNIFLSLLNHGENLLHGINSYFIQIHLWRQYL